jgi:hypothetical protein
MVQGHLKRRKEMNSYLLIGLESLIDHIGSIRDLGIVYWKKANKKMQIGDIVYLFISDIEHNRVMYRLEVVDTDSWSYTRLGKIDGLSESQLRTFLKAGESNITVTLSLTSDATGISNISNESRNTAGTESRSYTLNGTPASAGHKGIVIKDGKKFTK